MFNNMDLLQGVNDSLGGKQLPQSASKRIGAGDPRPLLR